MRSFSFPDLIKRVLPFFATLVIGVFVASFFVDLRGPGFGRGWRGHKHHEMKRLRIENEDLKNENLRLQNEIENLQRESLGSGMGDAKEESFLELNQNEGVTTHRFRGKGHGSGYCTGSGSGSGSSTR